jgi:hypothetical protein
MYRLEGKLPTAIHLINQLTEGKKQPKLASAFLVSLEGLVTRCGKIVNFLQALLLSSQWPLRSNTSEASDLSMKPSLIGACR